MTEYTNKEKVDLHVHLNGALPVKRTLDIVKKYSVDIPYNFNHDDLTINHPVDEMIKYFKPWFLLKTLPKSREILNDITFYSLESIAKDNVTYCEVRNSPFYISDLNTISIEESLKWLTEGFLESSKMLGITAKLIPSISRYNYNHKKAMQMLDAIGNLANSIIVGVDLSGDENSPVDETVEEFFRVAKEQLGLGICVHAGENTGSDNIKKALYDYGADRIGHGLSCIEDTGVIESLIKNNICLEICITTNLLTNPSMRLTDHPIKEIDSLSIPFVICTDNPVINNSTLSNELGLAQKLIGKGIFNRNFNYHIQYAFS